MEDNKYDSKFSSDAAMERDELTVPCEDIKFASTVSTVNGKEYAAPNKHASQDYAVTCKEFTVPSENIKFAGTVHEMGIKRLTVPSEGSKFTSSLPTVRSTVFAVPSEDNNYAKTDTEVMSKGSTIYANPECTVNSGSHTVTNEDTKYTNSTPKNTSKGVVVSDVGPIAYPSAISQAAVSKAQVVKDFASDALSFDSKVLKNSNTVSNVACMGVAVLSKENVSNTVSAVNRKEASGDTKLATKNPTVRSMGCTVPSEDTKYITTVPSERSRVITCPREESKHAITVCSVPSKEAKNTSSVLTVSSKEFTIPNEDTKYASKYVSSTPIMTNKGATVKKQNTSLDSSAASISAITSRAGVSHVSGVRSVFLTTRRNPIHASAVNKFASGGPNSANEALKYAISVSKVTGAEFTVTSEAQQHSCTVDTEKNDAIKVPKEASIISIGESENSKNTKVPKYDSNDSTEKIVPTYADIVADTDQTVSIVVPEDTTTVYKSDRHIKITSNMVGVGRLIYKHCL